MVGNGSVERREVSDAPQRGTRGFKIPELDRKIGKAFWEQREEQAMTRHELGGIIGMSGQMLAKYEHGIPSISISAVYAVAAGLDLDPREKLLPHPDDVGYVQVVKRPQRDPDAPSPRMLRKWIKLLNGCPPKSRPMMVKFIEELVDGFDVKSASH